MIPTHMSVRRRDGIARAVSRGLAASPEHYPRIPRPTGRRPNETERRKFLDLQKRRDNHAASLGLDPTVIASRGMLSDLAHNWEKFSAELMKWQRELLC